MLGAERKSMDGNQREKNTNHGRVLLTVTPEIRSGKVDHKLNQRFHPVGDEEFRYCLLI